MFLVCVIIFSRVNTPFCIVFLVHMRDILELENFSLRKSQESFGTEIMKKLRKFQYLAKKNFLIK